MGCCHAGKVGGATCCGDDGLDAVVGSGRSKFSHPCRSAVSGCDAGGVGDRQFVEDLEPWGEHWEVGVGSHHNSDERLLLDLSCGGVG